MTCLTFSQGQPNHTYYLPGQNADVKVSADYLFGQPVTHGHVRVVREVDESGITRTKVDLEEGDKYEGETDPSGAFTARVKLADIMTISATTINRRFKDITYAAISPIRQRTELSSDVLIFASLRILFMSIHTK